MRFCVGVLFLLASGAHSAYAGVIRNDRTDDLYQSLGASTAYDGVGQFVGTTASSGFAASGTLIAPNWVLTAAHVVDQATSLTFKIGGNSYSASQWAYYSKWTGDLSTGYDIALVKLSSSPGIASATRYSGSNEIGTMGTSVGYGKTGTGLTGAVTFDGLKRGGQNVIDRFYSSRNDRILLSDFDSPTNPNESSYGSSNPLNLEYLIAPGDSGGGLFVDFGNGPTLVGVHSFGSSRDGLVDSDYGDLSGHTRVSAFNSWIDSIMSGGSGTTGGGNKGGKGRPFTVDGFASDAVWMTAVPEPAPFLLLVAATLAFMMGQRPARRWKERPSLTVAHA
jgi:hypothetical protein